MSIEEIEARIEEINNLIDSGTLSNDEVFKLMNERQDLEYAKMHARREGNTESTTSAPEVEATPTQEEETEDNLYQHNVMQKNR